MIAIPRDEKAVYTYDDTDTMLDRREHIMDLLTPNAVNWEELQELLEIERELTFMEER